MDKKEYVGRIEKALVGKISSQELRDIVTYYRDYIDMEIRKGKTEAEVLEKLGDPRLLAKTIAMTHEKDGESTSGTNYENVTGNGKGTSGSVEYERRTKEGKRRNVHIPLIAVIAIAIFVVILVASLLFTVLRILFPIIFPLLLIIALWRFWRKN